MTTREGDTLKEHLGDRTDERIWTLNDFPKPQNHSALALPTSEVLSTWDKFFHVWRHLELGFLGLGTYSLKIQFNSIQFIQSIIQHKLSWQLWAQHCTKGQIKKFLEKVVRYGYVPGFGWWNVSRNGMCYCWEGTLRTNTGKKLCHVSSVMMLRNYMVRKNFHSLSSPLTRLSKTLALLSHIGR